jgi:hypothetical protein
VRLRALMARQAARLITNPPIVRVAFGLTDLVVVSLHDELFEKDWVSDVGIGLEHVSR